MLGETGSKPELTNFAYELLPATQQVQFSFNYTTTPEKVASYENKVKNIKPPVEITLTVDTVNKKIVFIAAQENHEKLYSYLNNFVTQTTLCKLVEKLDLAVLPKYTAALDKVKTKTFFSAPTPQQSTPSASTSSFEGFSSTQPMASALSSSVASSFSSSSFHSQTPNNSDEKLPEPETVNISQELADEENNPQEFTETEMKLPQAATTESVDGASLEAQHGDADPATITPDVRSVVMTPTQTPLRKGQTRDDRSDISSHLSLGHPLLPEEKQTILKGSVAEIHDLLQNKITPYTTDGDKTAWQYALQTNDANIIAVVLINIFSIRHTDPDQEQSAVEKLITRFKAFNRKIDDIINSNKQRLLHLACEQLNSTLVNLLLDSEDPASPLQGEKISLDHKDEDGYLSEDYLKITENDSEADQKKKIEITKTLHEERISRLEPVASPIPAPPEPLVRKRTGPKTDNEDKPSAREQLDEKISLLQNQFTVISEKSNLKIIAKKIEWLVYNHEKYANNYTYFDKDSIVQLLTFYIQLFTIHFLTARDENQQLLDNLLSKIKPHALEINITLLNLIQKFDELKDKEILNVITELNSFNEISTDGAITAVRTSFETNWQMLLANQKSIYKPLAKDKVADKKEEASAHKANNHLAPKMEPAATTADSKSTASKVNQPKPKNDATASSTPATRGRGRGRGRGNYDPSFLPDQSGREQAKRGRGRGDHVAKERTLTDFFELPPPSGRGKPKPP